MDQAALDELGETVVDWRFKGMPMGGSATVNQLRDARLGLFDGGFVTPLLTLDAPALDHNLELMASWAARHGLAHAPHGKTPLAPQLFDRQLKLGAWGITAATPSHVQMYRHFGVNRIFLGNELVDAPALRWLSDELARDPEFRFVCYVDSVHGVELMDAALTHRVDVVVELGAVGSRTGVRSRAEADEVARAVRASRWLRLVGVAGYEGTLAGVDETRAAVREWLQELVDAAHRFDADGLLADAEEIVVSAGGSEHFDLVAEALTEKSLELSRPVLRLLRSGAYVTHDHLHYAKITPLTEEAEHFIPALKLWAQVVSRPEPGLALVNAGKRDVPYDLGLPLPLEIRDGRTGEVRPAAGLSVTKLSDQHAFVSVTPDVELMVGDLIGLGLSHPCTALEKWQLIPEVDEHDRVVDYIRTFF
ncbi:alanine racemase [Streptacidiphilus jiangxiensis]|uniref:D-serine deaminase, pyridoxal phosphate-dependent n=1 Tax=Streptacidiphilus jiangxiensis TaxID=235985 RepID=A0A1H7FKR6_STRJI|nr:alanine racemase [Streptacidiphilus jiangxiensis]SEK26558.1 D-serine deaminase, pyridoxal phosphate-dependent [Streptacidiphilus jiangxiensis]